MNSLSLIDRASALKEKEKSQHTSKRVSVSSSESLYKAYQSHVNDWILTAASDIDLKNKTKKNTELLQP